MKKKAMKICKRKLSSLLARMGIKLAGPNTSGHYVLQSLDEKIEIGLRASSDFAYGSGWKYVSMLVEDLVRKSTDSFVILDQQHPAKKFAENPFCGSESIDEIRIKMDLEA